MTINGLGQFDMMSAYNRIDNITKVSVPQPQKVEEQAKVAAPAEEKTPELKLNLNLEGIRSKSNASLEDISRDFAKRENFSLQQFDAATMANDLEKAVSDMEKDSSLKQYQYFVGDSNAFTNVITDDEDGIVFMK